MVALLISALTAGLAAGMGLTGTMSTLVGGMGGNANTALSYVLLGALAYTINKTGAASILARKIASLVKGNKFTLFDIERNTVNRIFVRLTAFNVGI